MPLFWYLGGIFSGFQTVMLEGIVTAELPQANFGLSTNKFFWREKCCEHRDENSGLVTLTLLLREDKENPPRIPLHLPRQIPRTMATAIFSKHYFNVLVVALETPWPGRLVGHAKIPKTKEATIPQPLL